MAVNLEIFSIPYFMNHKFPAVKKLLILGSLLQEPFVKLSLSNEAKLRIFKKTSQVARQEIS